MRIAVVLNGRRSADEIAELAALAEANGVRQLWLSGGARTKDHFLRLAVAATRTNRIALGPVAISPFESHPARIGIALLTLHEITRGRSCIVLGGGGDLASTLGVPLRGRVQAVADTIDIIRALAQGGEVNYDGERFRVDGLFSPWSGIDPPPIYVGANRPRMIRMGTHQADGIMVTDMPLAHITSLVAEIQSGLAAAGRTGTRFVISNWFVWNVQEGRAEAAALARQQLGFRLYYIRDVASSLQLSERDAQDLASRQPAMLRALFEGRAPWTPEAHLTDLLIDQLTISGGREDLEACIERLRDFERAGVHEMALELHGDPARAIRLLGQRVVPILARDDD